MNRRKLQFFSLFFYCLLFATILPKSSAQEETDDPAEQCRIGVSHYYAQHTYQTDPLLSFAQEIGADSSWDLSWIEDALLLLEAGFAGRNEGDFNHPDDLGRCALALAVLRQRNSDFDGALEAYGVALTQFEESQNLPLKSTVLINMGGIYAGIGLIDEALNVLDEAQILQEELGSGTSVGILIHKALIFSRLGRYEESLRIYADALKELKEGGNLASEGLILSSMGVVYTYQGQYGTALETLEQALSKQQTARDEAGEGQTLANIAGVYLKLGRFDTALDYLDQALEKHLDPSTTAAILVNRASIYSDLGAYNEELYDRALNDYTSALNILIESGDLSRTSLIQNGIGSLFAKKGYNAEALQTFENARNAAHETGNHVSEGASITNIASIYVEQGRLSEALPLFYQALEIKQITGDKEGEASILFNIGNIHESQNEFNSALGNYRKAIDIFESIRAGAGNRENRVRFVEQFVELYHRVIALHVQDGQFSEAFFISERARARTFLDALATGDVQLIDSEAQELYEREQKLYTAKQLYFQMLSISSDEGVSIVTGENVSDNIKQNLAETETDYEATLEAIKMRKDALISLISGRGLDSVLDVEGIQKELERHTKLSISDSQSTLVSFWVMNERTIAFVLTSDSFNAISIDVTEETLNTQVKAFHDDLDSLFASAHPNTAVTLYETLITHIKPYLSTPHLIIVPHQSLHYIPFAALTDGQRYLIDDFAITYLPNASMLQFLPEADSTPIYETALIVGNPAADATDDFGKPFTPLYNAENTAITLAEMFETTPLLGDTAGETTVYENLSEANILHLGAHASFNTVAPLQSAIYLTPSDDETDMGDDGRLHVDEVYGLPMDNMELVVLSACETNLGYLDRDNPLTNISAGDELVSLNRAFLFQSPTVISTLWTVDDAATGLLMEQFYTNLLEGESKADALRLAQLDVRDFGNGEYANPYYWAGFVLSGDGGEIDLDLIQPLPTPTPEAETATPVAEETAVPEATKPLNSGGNGICAGAILPLALVALVIGRRKKPRNL